MIGVASLGSAPPAGQGMCRMPVASMYCCRDSRVWPGSREWGATGLRGRGDRVGLLVERGGVSVFVNGALIGLGPMAVDLPPWVSPARRECCCAGSTRKPRAP